SSQIAVSLMTTGGAPNNLPNGIPFTVRVTSSAFASTGGFRDFSGTTGPTPLVIPVPAGYTYNVSFPTSLVSGGQTWSAAAADASAAGGTGTNDIALSGANIVASDIVLSGAPASAADFQASVTFGLTGPVGTP